MDWAQFREAPLTHEIVLAAYDLPIAHPDPADRFLAATAEVLDLMLVKLPDGKAQNAWQSLTDGSCSGRKWGSSG